jgi:hypothetical protein
LIKKAMRKGDFDFFMSGVRLVSLVGLICAVIGTLLVVLHFMAWNVNGSCGRLFDKACGLEILIMLFFNSSSLRSALLVLACSGLADLLASAWRFVLFMPPTLASAPLLSTCFYTLHHFVLSHFPFFCGSYIVSVCASVAAM